MGCWVTSLPFSSFPSVPPATSACCPAPTGAGSPSPAGACPFAAGVFPCPPVPPLFGGVPACSVLSVFLRSTAALLAASICFLFASLYRFITFFNISSRLGTPPEKISICPEADRRASSLYIINTFFSIVTRLSLSTSASISIAALFMSAAVFSPSTSANSSYWRAVHDTGAPYPTPPFRAS